MKLGLVLAPCLFACTTTATTMDTREPSPRASVQVDLSTSSQDHAVFPKADSPRLPSVDRISHHVRARLGDEATASIDLCVAPDGRVTKVALVSGSSYEAFDRALLRDVEQWQFASQPGRTAIQQLQTCERATVKYMTP